MVTDNMKTQELQTLCTVLSSASCAYVLIQLLSSCLQTTTNYYSEFVLHDTQTDRQTDRIDHLTPCACCLG